MKQRFTCLTCFLALLITVVNGAATEPSDNGGSDLGQKCAQDVQKVIPCLDFVTAKAETPSKECCDAAATIKSSGGPKCLCYIIQQTHHGSAESKSLGVREDRLLQLPSACNVKDIAISDCPKLLGLSPSSPDTAIFTNASKVTPAPASTHPSPPAASALADSSYGVALRPPMITDLILVGLVIVLSAIPTGLFRIHA